MRKLYWICVAFLFGCQSEARHEAIWTTAVMSIDRSGPHINVMDKSGNSLSALIDTGASKSAIVIDSQAYKGLTDQDELEVETLAGIRKMRTLKPFEFKVGAESDFILINNPIALDGLPSAYTHDLVLGLDAIGQCSFVLDFIQERLGLSNCDKEEYIPTSISVKTSIHGKEYNCVLDTGYNGGTGILIQYYHPASVQFRNSTATYITRDSHHRGTVSEIKTTYDKQGQIAGLEGYGVLVYYEVEPPLLPGKQNECFISVGLLEGSVFRIDKKTTLAELRGKLPEAFYNRSGLADLDLSDGVSAIVKAVDKGSPAWNAGIRAEDQITHLNNGSIGDIKSADEFRSLLATLGTDLRLRVNRGGVTTEVVLVIKDFL